MPLSLPKPLSAGGMLVGSKGRATGRVEGPVGAAGLGVTAGLPAGVVVAFGAAALGAAALGAAATLLELEGRATAFGLAALRFAGAGRLAADRFASSFPARVETDDRLVVFRFSLLGLARLGLVADRLARVFPARLGVIRFADDVDFFAVERLAVDFLDEDFFFAGISPPSVRERWLAYGFSAELWDPTVFPACYSIGLAQRQALAHSAEAER